MDIPFRELLGREPDRVECLFDYGYRGVWKAFSGELAFVVKFDHRKGWIGNERAALEHAARGDVPVPAVSGHTDDPACLALEWVDGAALSEHSTVAAARGAGAALRRVHALPVLVQRAEPLAEWLRSWFEEGLGYMLDRRVIEPEERLAALSAFEACRPVLDATPTCWIHGDCQAAHLIIDPATGGLNAVIDWADARHGPPEIDFAVLTLFDPGILEPALDGYAADAEFRGRLALTMPLYQAIRAAGAFEWLEKNGYTGHRWPIERVKAFAARQ